MSETKIKLNYPKKHDGNEVKELVIRRSTTRDQIAIVKMARENGYTEADELAFSACALAQLSGLPLDFILDLDSIDFNRAAVVAHGFFIEGSQTPKN